MKKLLTLVLALTLSLTLMVCGAMSAAAAETTANLENPEFTPEQLAVAEQFAAMTTSFQSLADAIGADESLMSVEELVNVMNLMIEAVNKDDALFADPANLTAEVLENLEQSIVAGNSFIAQMEAMLLNYQGKNILTAEVEIVNETGVEIYGLAMSPANNTQWGGNLLTETLASGSSGVTVMTFTEDTLVWDLMAGDAQGNTLTFAGIDFNMAPVEGAKLVLSVAEDGGYMASFAQ
ncbi:MAG: hypothetical protein RR824_11020 [Clostridia bacterium]